MKWFILKMSVLLTFVLPITACDQAKQPQQRWYTANQVSQGKALFNQNCSQCHGVQAAGLGDNWQQKLADKDYPPPALNGSAHAWHHPMPQLKQTIAEGTLGISGYMPGFGKILSDEDAEAIIAYFQSFWSEDIYLAWQKRNTQ